MTPEQIAEKWVIQSCGCLKGSPAKGQIAADIRTCVDAAIAKRDNEWNTAVGMVKGGNPPPITPRGYVRGERIMKQPGQFMTKIDVETGKETAPPQVLTEEQAWNEHVANLESKYPIIMKSRS